MSADGVVLVHGASHSARCWDLVVPLLDSTAVAMDLPGRGTRMAEFATATLGGCVRAVIEAADQAGLQRFTLVGHSLGGVTITETAWRHEQRVASLVYVGALIPGQGQSAAEVMFGADLVGEPGQPDEGRCRAAMGNDMTGGQWAAHWKTIVPEPAAVWNARLSGYPTGIPTTYVSMADDVGAAPAAQMIANLGTDVAHRVTPGGHLAMVTKPRELAGVINDLVNC